MDGQSRAKLVAAGYSIFRQRNVYPVSPEAARIEQPFEIREKSHRGEWVLYDRYPTKAARERAWRELSKGEKNLMEYYEGNQEG
jgi:hypothetical protein